MIRTQDLARFTLLVPKEGGEVILYDESEVEVFRCGLQPGVHQAKQFVGALPRGGGLLPSPKVAAVDTKSGRAAFSHYGPGTYETGANPDFKPTLASEQEARLRRLVERAELANEKLAKAEKAAAMADKERRKAVKAEKRRLKQEAKNKEQAMQEEAETDVDEPVDE